MSEENYLGILEQSLKKKLGILSQIREKNEQQRILLLDKELAPEDFEENINTKAALVDQLELLDQGFEEIYARISKQLDAGRDQYKEQIQKLQELIRQVTAEGNSIQAEEQRNYKLAQEKSKQAIEQLTNITAT